MFDQISERFGAIFQRLGGYGRLSEKNISESLREVRRALLEADVNFRIVKEFIAEVKEKSIGSSTIKSIKPGQQIVKIIRDEMINLLGGESAPLNFDGKPPQIAMIVGLQGSGKTTFVGKFCSYLKTKGKNPIAVACDLYRPAAVDQLQTICNSVGIDFYCGKTTEDVLQTAKDGIAFAKKHGNDVVVVDTAGRLHIDEQMMMELQHLNELLSPKEIFYVADGMAGQDAVNSAKFFDEQLNFDRIVLTKMDGDSRGGAAISIVHETKKPIQFLSMGEKIEDLEEFHPDRMAGRILGMGDVVSLVEKAQSNLNEQQIARMEKKIKTASFDLNDLLDQIEQMKQMGSMEQIVSMIPGGSKLVKKGLSSNEKEMIRFRAIIQSMTSEERKTPKIIDGSRRKRIAKGSGTRLQDVNLVLKQFFQMQKLMKTMNKKHGKFRQIPSFFN